MSRRAITADMRPTGALDRAGDRQRREPYDQPDRRRDLAQILAELERAARERDLDFEFRADERAGVAVVSRSTGRVIRSMPVEEAVRLAALLRAGRQQLMDRVL